MPNRLDNCRICGRLFLKDHTENCLDCYKEVEQEFKYVIEFLLNEQNRYATIEIVSESTNVSLKQIAEFMRDGRIYADDYPNLGFPCAHCGKLIKRQVLCDDCFDQFSSEVNTTLKRDKLVGEVGRKERLRSIDAQYWRLKRNK
ncbi:flagellar protein [Paenisporosarcina indica]|uniref:flagellar protein n=1 Tax=Paenisporosarcina indica TaxID=650093 RepID=UPI00094FC8A7|nr:flagellar protein [Paenisporosarcina indica]